MAHTPNDHTPDRGEPQRAVLVVDDERAIRQSLERLLSDAGYVVDLAEDGLDALQKVRLRREPYAAVVLDVMMPNLDGLAVLERLQSEHPETEGRVVLLTAWSEAPRVQQETRPSGCPVLEKPVKPEELLCIVERIVAQPGGKPARRWDGANTLTHILVVDDDPAIRRVLTRYLTGQGYRVYPAEDGAEALAVLRRTAIDLALIDLEMPRMSGIELVQRCEDEFSHLSYVVMSGQADAVALAERKLRLPPVLLRKPFALEQVDAIVARALDSRT